MNQLPRIIDNNRKSLLEIFQLIVPQYDTLSIATGYWDLKGMQEVFDQIRSYKKIRLLIGREPLIPRHKQYEPEPDFPDKDFFYDLERMQPRPELKELVCSIKTMIEQGNLEVKVYRKTFLHAKCYIFGNYSSENAIGIIGSSNFTANGLTGNTELNALEPDHRIVTFQPQSENQEVGHLYWFDQFWNDPETEDWNGAFTFLLESSPIGDVLFSPYETYIRTLMELYREELEEEAYQPSKDGYYSLYEFQQQNVQALKRKLKKHKVAMLSDSVGLGKTITALEVIRAYKEDQRRIVVICPKSLVPQWDRELTKTHLRDVKPIVMQNMGQIEKERELDRWAGVSLFVIDESHNLRKTGGERYQAIVAWIRQNPKAHVLLLTATPVNNELSDLVNQLLLGTRGRGDAFPVLMYDDGIESEVSFTDAIKRIETDMKRQISEGKEINFEKIRQVISPIIRQVVVRRTRQGIVKEFGGIRDPDGKLLEFPRQSIKKESYTFPSDLADKLREMALNESTIPDIFCYAPEDIAENCSDFLHPLDQIDKLGGVENPEIFDSPITILFQLILFLGLVPYRWKMYDWKYYGKTAADVRTLRLNPDENRQLQQQRGIYGIFRTIFLKRLESSVAAIKKSLETYEQKLDIFAQGLEENKIIKLKIISKIWKDFDPEGENFDDLLMEEGYEDLDPQKYQVAAMKADIAKDRQLLQVLKKLLAEMETQDAKLDRLVELLNGIGDKKVIVFSYFSDTIEYLKAELIKRSASPISEDNAFFLSSKNRDEAEEVVGRFAPKAQDKILTDKEAEFQYLFATDVLSEGQNLQDAGILVNYDLHWNPVRMIQRNGRINRLGSEHAEVTVCNMSPEVKLETYLKLVKRLEGKIDLIRYTIGTDQSVLGEAAKPTDYVDDIADIYSDDEQKSLEALERLDKAGDFLLAEDDYIKDLKAFMENPDFSEEYKRTIIGTLDEEGAIASGIPCGKWSTYPQTHVHEHPEVLALSRVTFERENGSRHVYPHFLVMNRQGKSRNVIPSLHALSYLRTSVDENARMPDKISLDRAQITKAAQDPQSYSALSESDATAVPRATHQAVLERMQSLGYDFDDIAAVRDAVQTKNVLDKKEFKRQLNSLAQKIRANDPHHDELETLAELARQMQEEKDAPAEVREAEPVLFYTDNT